MEDEDTRNDDLDIPLPSIEISLTISQNFVNSPNYILSVPAPLFDRYVELVPSKLMELSAIPFLNATSPSLW